MSQISIITYISIIFNILFC